METWNLEINTQNVLVILIELLCYWDYQNHDKIATTKIVKMAIKLSHKKFWNFITSYCFKNFNLMYNERVSFHEYKSYRLFKDTFVIPKTNSTSLCLNMNSKKIIVVSIHKGVICCSFLVKPYKKNSVAVLLFFYDFELFL